MNQSEPLIRTPLVAVLAPCTVVMVLRVGEMSFGGRLHIPHSIAYPYDVQWENPEEEGPV